MNYDYKNRNQENDFEFKSAYTRRIQETGGNTNTLVTCYPW